MLETKKKYARIPGVRVGYRIGRDGSFWSRWRRGKGQLSTEWRLNRVHLNQQGVAQVRPRDHQGRLRNLNLGRLVLELFGNPRPSPYHVCKHKDGDPENCTLENLKWVYNPGSATTAWWMPHW